MAMSAEMRSAQRRARDQAKAQALEELARLALFPSAATPDEIRSTAELSIRVLRGEVTPASKPKMVGQGVISDEG